MLIAEKSIRSSQEVGRLCWDNLGLGCQLAKVGYEPSGILVRQPQSEPTKPMESRIIPDFFIGLSNPPAVAAVGAVEAAVPAQSC